MFQLFFKDWELSDWEGGGGSCVRLHLFPSPVFFVRKRFRVLEFSESRDRCFAVARILLQFQHFWALRKPKGVHAVLSLFLQARPRSAANYSRFSAAAKGRCFDSSDDAATQRPRNTPGNLHNRHRVATTLNRTMF